jgi:hypothetical protein
MLAVLGLNGEIWPRLSSREKTLYRLASFLFLGSAFTCLVAGIRFMVQLSDSYVIGIIGGLIVGAIIAMVTRVALITLVSKPLLPTESHSNAKDSILPSSKMQKLSHSLPDFSVVFRLLIISLLAFTVAFPIVSLIEYSESELISANRRSEVFSELKANHPEMSDKEKLTLKENLSHEHFPIHVYRILARNNGNIILVFLTWGVFTLPFFLLLHLRNSEQFEYAKLNRDELIKLISTEYTLTIEQSRFIQTKRYGLQDPITPNKVWEDAPFNTRKREPSSVYQSIDFKTYIEHLKTL